jgi:hypothetical protein
MQNKTLLYEILFFLDWREYATICDKLGISLKFHIYVKYNNSLQNFDNCYEYYENVQNHNKNIMDCASFYGHLEIVKFLHSTCRGNTRLSMDWASNNGHLEIVKYLYSIGEKCTTSAINYASINKYLEIAKFLKSNQL